MRLKDYLKGNIQIFIWFPMLFVISLFTTEDIDELAIRILIPTFLILIPTIVLIYGLIKYK
jgi:hypothetical protein